MHNRLAYWLAISKDSLYSFLKVPPKIGLYHDNPCIYVIKLYTGSRTKIQLNISLRETISLEMYFKG